MTFVPTHEFRGLELEWRFDIGDGSARFQDASGNGYYLPKAHVSEVQPKPQPGEIWKIINMPSGEAVFYGVDCRGRLYKLESKTTVWDPEDNNPETLKMFTKAKVE